MKRRTVLLYAAQAILLWFAALYLTWTVNRRLAIAFVLGSVAHNLSEWVREKNEQKRRFGYYP